MRRLHRLPIPPGTWARRAGGERPDQRIYSPWLGVGRSGPFGRKYRVCGPELTGGLTSLDLDRFTPEEPDLQDAVLVS